MHPTSCAAWTAAGLAALAIAAPASNHREAPITALDHKADITDLYAFRSYDGTSQVPSTNVTLILCVDPLLEPANGPTTFPFDPSILYEIKVDNDHDALEDKIVRFRFTTKYQLPNVYTSLAGIGQNGANDPTTGAPVVPPQITSLSSPGLNQRQTYTVEIVDTHTGIVIPLSLPGGAPFIACPVNAGPRTVNYELLFQEATYQLAGGFSVFAGTTDDAFWIDLGAAFDTANFRTLGSGIPGVLTAQEDAALTNFASDTVSGYAVNTLAIEIPINLLTSTGAIEPATSPAAVLGVWGVTSRPMTTRAHGSEPAGRERDRRPGAAHGQPADQRARHRDRPEGSIQHGRARERRAVRELLPRSADRADRQGALRGRAVGPAAPRTDLLPLVTYAPPIAPPGTPAGPIADLLRLNTGVPATPLASASRLGLLGGDPAGFPNGRRVFDDVTDITLRVAVGGVLAAPFPGFDPNVNGRLGDGVNVNDLRYHRRFPYVASCADGRNRRHFDPGEPGGGPVR